MMSLSPPGQVSFDIRYSTFDVRHFCSTNNPRNIECRTSNVEYRSSRAQWTARESHPDLRLARAASSCWTSSPDEVVKNGDRHRPVIGPGLVLERKGRSQSPFFTSG